MNLEAQSFTEALSTLRLVMLRHSQAVHTETWQGMKVADRPEAEMRELLNVDLAVPLKGIEDLEHWRRDCAPNLPWADEHFLERVSGQPLNPPPSWVRWPWANAADKSRTAEGGKFNHTYPERYWPKRAGDLGVGSFHRETHTGIRGEYGDLGDVVQLLVEQPLTRQAYMPMFFPEDTGVGDGGRKPCTLGYQFIMRADALHCYYPMRSCDLMRHLPDDLYLTVRLLLWVLDQARAKSERWAQVRAGSLVMHMTSLHVFINDLHQLKKA